MPHLFLPVFISLLCMQNLSLNVIADPIDDLDNFFNFINSTDSSEKKKYNLLYLVLLIVS